MEVPFIFAHKKTSFKIILLIVLSFTILIIKSEIFLSGDLGSPKDSKNDLKEEDDKVPDSHYTPKGVRLTIINDLSNSVVITWFTNADTSNPIVEYSTNSELLNSKEVKAITKKISGTFIYTTELSDLNSSETYYYSVSSDESHKREIMSFTTIANRGINQVRFLVYGDTRSQRDVRSALSEKIMGHFRDDFEFTINLGDIVDDGRDQDLWNNYFEDTEELNAYKQGIYIEGNHEKGLETLMYDNLPMISTENNRYYAFSYGDIGLIILNSNSYTIDDDDQTDWLNETLFQFSQKNSFNFAFMHHPLLHNRSQSCHREKWRPLFEKYNVSCIFAGHNHHYERSYPITNLDLLEFDNSELYRYKNLKNPIYFVSGSAGAPLYDLYDFDFIAKNQKAYHFILVEIKKELDKTTLSIEVWGMPEDFGDLYLFDTITIINRAKS